MLFFFTTNTYANNFLFKVWTSLNFCYYTFSAEKQFKEFILQKQKGEKLDLIRVFLLRGGGTDFVRLKNTPIRHGAKIPLYFITFLKKLLTQKHFQDKIIH